MASTTGILILVQIISAYSRDTWFSATKSDCHREFLSKFPPSFLGLNGEDTRGMMIWSTFAYSRSLRDDSMSWVTSRSLFRDWNRNKALTMEYLKGARQPSAKPVPERAAFSSGRLSGGVVLKSFAWNGQRVHQVGADATGGIPELVFLSTIVTISRTQRLFRKFRV
jgi:hypothetical protein